MRAKKYKDTATHAWAISHARSAGPPDPPATSDPTSELVIYAVSGPGNQPSGAASGSKPTTGAVDLPSGAAIREDAFSAAVVLAAASAAAVLLLLLRRRLLLVFTFGYISHWYVNSRAT